MDSPSIQSYSRPVYLDEDQTLFNDVKLSEKDFFFGVFFESKDKKNLLIPESIGRFLSHTEQKGPGAQDMDKQ